MAARPTNTTAHTLDERLDELVTQFINRLDQPGLSYAEESRLRASTENEALFRLLGSLSYAVSAHNRTLTKKQLLDIVERVLTPAMTRLAPHDAAA